MIAILRDPLTHFVILGAVVFAIRAPASQTRIDVDAVLVDDIRAQLAATLERAPTDGEVSRAVDDWIDEEMLVREARTRGLDRGDPQIRARLAERMAFLLGAREAPGAPDDATLRALYAAQRDALQVEMQVTLRQCFAGDSRTRAEALLAEAEGGASPRALAARCDAPPGGPVLRGRSAARLARRYGAGFVDGLATAPLDTWHLRRSTLGWHVVRIEARRDARAIPFDEARTRLIARWRRERIGDAASHAMTALKARYHVTGWPR